jgi:hypothetical protein
VPSILPLTLPFVPGSGSGPAPTPDELSFHLEVAWSDTPRSASPTYTDMTDYVRASAGVSFQRGRSNEQDAQAQPGRASWEFINDNGDFTMGNGSSPYAPLQIRRPVRITARYDVTTYTLWQGFIDSWENASDDTMGYVRVSASDRLARAATVKLPGMVAGEILADSPAVLYTLGDDEGSQIAGDLSGNNATPLKVESFGAGGVVDFGTGVAPGPDGGTVAAFTTRGATDYATLTVKSPNNFGSSEGYTLECFFKFSGSNAGLVSLYNAAREHIDLYTTGGAFQSGGTAVNDGEWHHAAVAFYGLTSEYYLDGVLYGSGGGSSSTFDTLYVGSALDGQIAYVAVHPTVLDAARIRAHAEAGLTGGSGDTTDERFARLCNIGGLPSSHYGTLGTGQSTMCAQPTQGAALLDLLRQCAEAEDGVTYIAGNGLLTFAPRSIRQTATSAYTLDATLAGHVGDGFTYTTDDSLVLNDLTVTRPGGITQRVTDAASITAYETHDDTLTLYVDTDEQIIGAAEWMVGTHATPALRGSQIDVELRAFSETGGDLNALLATDVGTLITVGNLPTDVAPSSSVSLFVEGIAGRIEKDRVTFTLTTSPQQPHIFTFDDPVYGLFDGVGVFGQ